LEKKGAKHRPVLAVTELKQKRLGNLGVDAADLEIEANYL